MDNNALNLQIFNSTYAQLCAQKHNIYIGISIGVKPMSQEIALSYLEWAKEFSNGTVQILLADEIAKFNYLGFSHYTKPGCLARALRDGDKYQAFFEKVLAKFPAEKSQSFNITRWKDIKSPRFHLLLDRVTKEFETNPDFQRVILSFADKYIGNRCRQLSQEKKIILCQYLLHELPALLDGIHVNGVNYNLILYPTYKHSGMSELVSEIRAGNKFTSITDGLDPLKTIMVESIIKTAAPNEFPMRIEE